MAEHLLAENLMIEYSAAMRRRRFAAGTISKRLTVARGWLEHAGDGWTSATWRDIEAYGDTRQVGASTWRDEVSHLSHFYQWAMRYELAPGDPTALVERPRVHVGLPRPASPLQYLALLDGATPTVRAAVELAAWCGLRCCEIAALRWSDIDLVARKAIVHGKGGRDRSTSMSRAVVQALAAIDGSGDDHVLLKSSGQPFTAAGISRLIGDWCRHQGVPVTAHQLRHKYATWLLEATDGDLMAVRDALGHASVSSTEIYAQVSWLRAQRIARLIDEHHEQNRLF